MLLAINQIKWDSCFVGVPVFYAIIHIIGICIELFKENNFIEMPSKNNKFGLYEVMCAEWW